MRTYTCRKERFLLESHNYKLHGRIIMFNNNFENNSVIGEIEISVSNSDITSIDVGGETLGAGLASAVCPTFSGCL